MVRKPVLRSENHISQVDYIRAIASVAVALFHLGGKTLPVLKYGWLGVQLFFFLSGFIICYAMPKNYSWKQTPRFLLKRLIRIEPPYFVSIIIAVVVNFFWITDYRPDWVNIASHLAYLNSFFGQAYLSPVYWTLGIEFQFYLFIAVFFPLITMRWGNLLVLIFCLLPILLELPGTTLAPNFPIFAFGILYFLYYTKRKTLRETLVFMVMVATASVHIGGWLATTAALFALALLIFPLKSYPAIRFFSKISFSLYLTHDMIGSNLVVYLGTQLPKNMLFKSIEFSIGITASIVFAYLFYKIIEAPCLKASKKITYRHQNVWTSAFLQDNVTK